MIKIEHDINFIFSDNILEKNKEILFEIEPISSLCIIDDPGNYAVFSHNDISIKILSMIENMLLIDIPKHIRQEILKKINTKYKKFDVNYENRYNNNKHNSIFFHLADIDILNLNVFENADRFFDLQKRNIRNPYKGVHVAGLKNKTKMANDFLLKVIELQMKIKDAVFCSETAERDTKHNKRGNPNKRYIGFTKEDFSKIPHYYGDVFYKENIVLKENILVSIKTTQSFYDFIKSAFENEKVRFDLYLGNSESLVNVKNIKF